MNPVTIAALEGFAVPNPESVDRAPLVAALEADNSLRSVWLCLAVLSGALPTEGEVRWGHRALLVQGPAFFIEAASTRSRVSRSRRVELLHNAVVIDVRHTAETDLATGIQRVARETVKRWESWHEVTLVTWTADGRAMRRLMPEERETAINGLAPVHGSTGAADKHVVVPVGGDYILPELAAEMWRTERVAAMGQFAGLRTGVIGFDTVPLTSAETVGDGMPSAFARNLNAVAQMSKVGAISEAAAHEYRGWKRMLSASGIAGPEIESVLLAAEPGFSTKDDEREFAELVGASGEVLVVVVGSHEPRKNHMAVLQAAESAWRAGLEFRLVFIGGNSWNSLVFTDSLSHLQAAGRPVVSVSALPDRLLWAAYRAASFTVFTSLNEGFGLPVAESLSCGTPVITSNYGSMAQIASAGGAIVVNPRDDASLLAGLRSMLTDHALYERLRVEAAAYVVRPWDTYATELWDYFRAPAPEAAS